MSHTPGPWKLQLQAGARMVISPTGYHGKPSTICYCWPVTGEYGETANARLIAAAPELLAALKRVKDTGVFFGAIPQGMVDAAIAKAEGQS
jgi:hypothetical protein